MAGRARYTALLDACVLYPLAMADSLMSVAATSLYAAKWTLHIEREWMNALVRNRPDLAGRLEPRRDAMRDAVPDWEVAQSLGGISRKARSCAECRTRATSTCLPPPLEVMPTAS
jgi:hypothetical protein